MRFGMFVNSVDPVCEQCRPVCVDLFVNSVDHVCVQCSL